MTDHTAACEAVRNPFPKPCGDPTHVRCGPTHLDGGTLRTEWWVEPLAGGGRFGPYDDEIEASEAMDALDLDDSEYKIVPRSPGEKPASWLR